jgi:hypothetical protein
MTTRCIACHDPAPNGWTYCRQCHSWHDVAVALGRVELGIDLSRLRRGLNYLQRRKPRRESVRALLERLMGRVAELEHRQEYHDE